MAIPNALNRDDFLTGKLVGPDPVVRSAMAKVMNPQGLPPMTQKELDRLLNRQFYEEQQVKQANAYQGSRLYEARQAIASGQMAPIDVNSYAGSMYSAPGSYTAARPISAPTRPSIQQSADRMLRANYGEMQPGQVQVSDLGGDRVIEGTPRPRGIQGMADTLLTDTYGAMQPGQQMRVAGIPDEMLVPARAEPTEPAGEAPAGGYAQPAGGYAQPAAAPRPTSFGPALSQLMGPSGMPSGMPALPSLTPRTPSAMTVADVFASTPDALARTSREQEARQKQLEALRKSNIESASTYFAQNQRPPEDLLSQMSRDELNQAYVKGVETQKGADVTYRVDRVIDGKNVPFEIRENRFTGARTESQIRQPYATPEEVAAGENKKALIASGIRTIEEFQGETKLARNKAELAMQMTDALRNGATAGVFAEISAKARNLAESVSDKDYGASIQRLYVQAGKRMTLEEVRGLMRGLGSMSNDDRVQAQAAFMSITDPKQAVLYYAELARLNYERQLQIEDRIAELQDSNQTADVIAKEVRRAKNDSPFLSQIARKNVGLDTAAPAAPAAPSAQPSATSYAAQIAAERERRAKLGKQPSAK
jgi:hypothetical protein